MAVSAECNECQMASLSDASPGLWQGRWFAHAMTELRISRLYFDQGSVLPKSKLSITFTCRDEKHALQLLPTPLISKQLLP